MALTTRAGDPEARLLSHFPRRRLEAEAIRDGILAVSDQLDQRMFGPGTLESQQRRRSIYFTIKRSQLIPILLLFDAPDALSGLAERSSTTVAPQSLWLMNNPAIRQAAADFARRIEPATGATEPGQVRAALSRAYQLALSRDPGPDETEDALAFLEVQEQGYRKTGQAASSRELAFIDYCQVLLSLNEFLDLP